MAKSTTKTTDNVVAAVVDHSSKLPNRSPQVAQSDIAYRAFDLCRARSCKDGYDVPDWLQAERDLRKARPLSTV